MTLKANDIIEEACNGNEDAKEYLYMMCFFARTTDDIFDEFENVSQIDIQDLIQILFVRLPLNRFYQKHRDFLLSQHLLIWNTWTTSNVLQNGDETDKLYAHVLRETFNELASVVSLLTHGYSKMEEIKFKSYFSFKKKLGE